MLKKSIHIIVAVLFISFAVVQFNDRDGILWIFVYLMVAALPILMLFKIEKKHINYFLLGFLPMLLFLNHDSVTGWLNAGKPAFIDYEPTTVNAVEGIREYLGLVVCFVTTLIYLFIKKRPQIN